MSKFRIRAHYPYIQNTLELPTDSDIIRECFDSSVRTGRSALEALGVHPFEAERKSRYFVEFDQKSLRELAPLYDPEVPVHLN